MQLVIGDVSVQVSKKKINPTLLLPKLRPFVERKGEFVEAERQRRYYNRETGDYLGTSQQVTYADDFVLDGEVLEANVIQWFLQNGKGELVPSKQFEATKTVTPLIEIKRSDIQNYKFESAYEVYIKKSEYNDAEYLRISTKLFAKAEEWIANNTAGIGKFVHRKGTKSWVAIIFPIIREVDKEFKYAWILATTNTKYHYEKMMAVPKTKPAIPVAPEPEIPLEQFI